MIGKILFWIQLSLLSATGGQYTDTTCTIERLQKPGVCKSLKNCPSVFSDVQRNKPFQRCGFEGQDLIVCCPDAQLTTTTTPSPFCNRISAKKCEEYKSAMYEYVTPVLLISGDEATKVKVDKCGHKSIPLIVGGVLAKPKEFPHMALLGYNITNTIEWACGGSLISEQYVLTAAHCLISKLYGEPRYVRLGELTLNTEDDDARQEDFDVAEIIMHPKYKRSSKYNDIALLKLSRKVDINPYKRPACLPLQYDEPGERVIATGWGHTEWAGNASDHLLKVVLDKFNQADCNETYRYDINRRLRYGIQYETQLCAGSKTERKDACQGDSGGPIQVYHREHYCMYTIVGVTSFGATCGNIGYPGVYTRVYGFLDWIESVVWGSTSCKLSNTDVEGTCKSIESCHTIIDDIRNGKPYDTCGYDKTVLIVCCPPKRPSSTTEGPPRRISEIKCDEYKSAVYEYVQSISMFRDQDEWTRPVDKCGNRELTTNLSYGEYAQPREFPHMASIGYQEYENPTYWLCGGSLISDQYVLTVAHCIFPAYSGPPRYVRLGELNFESQQDDAQPEDFEVAETIPHPNYKRSSYYNDIGLIKLNRKAILNPYKRPLCLPTMNEEDKHAIATGWGASDSKDEYISTHLVKVTLDKFSHEECYEEYGNYTRRLRNGISNESHICYGSKTDKRDTCRGDSGGPLQVFHRKNYCMYTIIGITSFGASCAIKGIPGVYTRVSTYVEWIESVVWNEG